VLVEIAIVLALVSLILVSIAHVESVIEQARARALATDFEQIQSAARAYKGRYGAFPGDDPRAGSRWQGALSGDGNGALSLSSPAQASSPDGASGLPESSLFWLHLRLAGLIPGDPARSDATQPPVLATGVSLGLRGDAVGYAGIALCVGNVRGTTAEALDLRLDDGHPASGLIRAGSTLRSPSVLFSATATYTVCAAMSDLKSAPMSATSDSPAAPSIGASSPDESGTDLGEPDPGRSDPRNQGRGAAGSPSATRPDRGMPGAGDPPSNRNADDRANGQRGAAPGQARRGL
jgi:hypothetical protein